MYSLVEAYDSEFFEHNILYPTLDEAQIKMGEQCLNYKNKLNTNGKVTIRSSKFVSSIYVGGAVIYRVYIHKRTI